MLNKRTVYALHALIHLAKAGPGACVGASKLAASIGCSPKFLERILLELKQAGTLISTTGRAGGYALQPDANRISLAEIVRPLEGPIALLPCASHRFYEPCSTCPSPEACGLRLALVDVRNASVDVLKRWTLASVVAAEGDLLGGLRSMDHPVPYEPRTFAP
jgi:Rrf2 family protein